MYFYNTPRNTRRAVQMRVNRAFRISELIDLLSKIKEDEGDLPIFLAANGDVHEPFRKDPKYEKVFVAQAGNPRLGDPEYPTRVEFYVD